MARGLVSARVKIVGRPVLRSGRVRRSLLAIMSAVAVMIGLVAGIPAPAAASPGPSAPPMFNDKSVPVSPVASHYQHPKAPPAWKPAPVTWPSGTADVSLVDTQSPHASAGTVVPAPQQVTVPVRAGSLPVWVAPAPSTGPAAGSAKSTSTPAPVPAKVHVSVTSRAAAAAVGVNGALVGVQRSDASASAGQVAVSVGYGQFADAFGGDWASRLRLVTLPACALTTPNVPSCRTQTPVAFTRDVKAGQLTATLSLPGVTRAANSSAVSEPMVVLAATSSASGGGGGDYTATTLKPSGSWQAGGSTDSFSWSYPITVPSVPGGLSPQVQLSYDSQGVDGLTSSTNNQAS